MRSRTFVAALVLAGTAALAAAESATAYQVRSGDTLWGISRQTGVPVQRIAADNGIRDPDRIYAGQRLRLESLTPAQAPAPAPAAAPAAPDRRVAPPPSMALGEARTLVFTTARQRGLDPNLALAVADWESGFNQSRVSSVGAVGIMQVMPTTADWAGPALLHRRADVHNPHDNIQLGVALLRRYVDEFHDPKLALAAYYQGAAAVHKQGIYPGSHGYVDGIWALRNRFAST